MKPRLVQWRQLLVDALVEHPTVAVQTVVENHLGRRPSRSEQSAARRAAHTLAGRGDAVLHHLTVKTGAGRTRLIISRPPDTSAGNPDRRVEDAPERPAVTRWLDVRIDQAPPVRFGRWQQAILEAVDRYEVVGVRAVVEGHLGRRGARAESAAAQRAARLLARSGQARLAHVRVPAAKDRRSAELLVVARTTADLARMSDQELQSAATRYLAPADQSGEALAYVVAAVERAAAAAARDVDVHLVDPQAADRAARALAVPLSRLTRLRQSLLHRRTRARHPGSLS